MKEAIPQGINLQVMDIGGGIAGTGEHVVPLEHLMQKNPVKESSQAQPEEETGREGKVSRLARVVIPTRFPLRSESGHPLMCSRSKTHTIGPEGCAVAAWRSGEMKQSASRQVVLQELLWHSPLILRLFSSMPLPSWPHDLCRGFRTYPPILESSRRSLRHSRHSHLSITTDYRHPPISNTTDRPRSRRRPFRPQHNPTMFRGLGISLHCNET